MGDAAESEALWRFVPLAAFQPPPEPTHETVRRGWRRFLTALWRQDDDASAPPEPAPPLAAGDRQAFLPPDHLPERAAALWSALEPCRSDTWTVAIIDPPGGGGAAALTTLAQVRGWPVIEPPEPESLLAAPTPSLPGLDRAEPLVIPRLERMFLRSPAGLDWLRRLGEGIERRTSPTLVACSSWAWRYLDATLGFGRIFRHRLAPGAMDAARLRRWFGTALPDGVCDGEGRWVVPPQDREEAADEDRYLVRLAATASGSMGIARAIWAEALRRPGAEESGAAHDASGTLEVVSWPGLDLPHFPAPPGRIALMLLQLLLLHGPLPEPLIRSLLPDPPFQIGIRLAQLAAWRLIERGEGGWRVTSLGYPAARRELRREGFWIDGIGSG